MINVCVLFGGDSSEREVSILSCKEIISNLDKSKYNVFEIELPINNNNNEWVKKIININPDIVLSALHGGKGEDGSVQGLLECLSIKYVGSKVLASSISLNKQISKEILKLNNIPIIDGLFIKKNDQLVKYESKFNEIGYPLIVKPNCGGSSIGINIVNNYEDLKKAVDEVILLNDDILIEKYIKGREVTCGIIETNNGLKILSVLDIDTENKFYDYKAKYEDDNTFIEFSSLPEYLKEMIKEIAQKVFLALNCNGYGRVDMIVNEEQVYVLEMNTLPGLTSHSLIPKSASEIGDFQKFLDLLIDFEFNKVN